MTNKTGAFILTGDSVTVVIGAVNYTLDRSHAMFSEVLNSIRSAQQNGDWAEVETRLNIANKLSQNGSSELWFNKETGEVFWNEEPLNTALSNRITDMWRDGFDTEPLLAFCRNLFANPSTTAINELYDFMEKNVLPLTTDGCFLAYKKVREDYKDCYTGTIDNSVGCVVEMDRNICDPIRENHCSTGLHFCGLSYLTCFGGERVVIVKINPADVTSIPSDYNFAKGRCCKYEVVEEYGGTDVQRFEAWSSSVADWDAEYNEDDEIDASELCGECGYEFDECCCSSDFDPDPDQTDEGDSPVITGVTNPIRRARIAAGLTAMTVAEGMGLSLNAFFHTEREGAKPSPSVVGNALSAIQKIAKNLGDQ
jgi:hypothetical protein